MAINTQKNIGPEASMSPGIVVLTLAVLAIIVMVGYHLMEQTDTRTSGEYFTNTISGLSDDFSHMGEELRPVR